MISFGLWEKRSNDNRENERKKEKRKKKKKKKQRREWEKKKNPEEREIIDKISSCSNILMQEIRLLMYSSSSDLMSYCSWGKKKKRILASLLEAWIVDILSIFSLYFTYVLAVGDALRTISKKRTPDTKMSKYDLSIFC